MMEKKVTKIEYFEMVRNVVENAEVENGAELVEFLNKQIDQLKAKAAKAKERADNKKAEGDLLRNAVAGALSPNEFRATPEILRLLVGEWPDLTRAKVSARLTQLVNLGVVEKAPLKNEEGKTVMHYKFIG